MVAESPSIVHGEVLATTSRWTDDKSTIVTDVRVRVIDSLKGQDSGEVVVTQIGGVVGALRVEVYGATALRPGDETILFLNRDRRGRSLVTGLSQGQFPVEEDKTSRKKVIRGISRDQLKALQSLRGPLRAADTVPGGAVTLDWFKGGMRDLVRDVVKKGGR